MMADFGHPNQTICLMQDGAPAHTSRATLAFVAEELPGLRLLQLPPRSPDLNIIEILWGVLYDVIHRYFLAPSVTLPSLPLFVATYLPSIKLTSPLQFLTGNMKDS